MDKKKRIREFFEDHEWADRKILFSTTGGVACELPRCSECGATNMGTHYYNCIVAEVLGRETVDP